MAFFMIALQFFEVRMEELRLRAFRILSAWVKKVEENEGGCEESELIAARMNLVLRDCDGADRRRWRKSRMFLS